METEKFHKYAPTNNDTGSATDPRPKGSRFTEFDADGNIEAIDDGHVLYATYSGSYTAYASSDIDDETGRTYYRIAYCKEALPPHKVARFDTVGEMKAAMAETAEPSKWNVDIGDE